MSTRFLSVQQLLTALVGLSTISAGWIAYDAERLITAVDDLKKSQYADHSQVLLNADGLGRIEPRVDKLEVSSADHDVRLTVLEKAEDAVVPSAHAGPVEKEVTRELNLREENRHKQRKAK